MTKTCMVLVLCGLFACYRQVEVAASGTGWTYEGSLGPDVWHTHFPKCGGRMQSPINIDRSQVLYDQQLASFDLSQYSVCSGCTMTLENVGGHTAEVIFGGSQITIKGGSLPDEYVLDQFHFHWGKTNNVGSEHLLNSKAAPLEMHIVHHMKKFDTVSQAAENPYGLAVLGFFFTIGSHNNAFDKLLSNFSRIIHIDNKTELEPFALSSLLPSDNNNYYYRYYGSLTTPPCYETVIWTLFTKTIEISQAQLEIFRTLRTVKENSTVEEELSNDFRPIQELHERRVTSNDKTLFDDINEGVVKKLIEEIKVLKDECKASSGSSGLHAVAFLQMLVWGLFFLFR